MKKFKYILLVLLTVVSGFIGGMFSNWLFERPVVAQETANVDWDAIRDEGPKVTRDRKIIEAQEFRVVDKNGKECISLTEIAGFPHIALFDENEKERISLVVRQRGTGVTIRDKYEKVRISLAEFNDNPYIYIRDKYEKPRIRLGESDGDPSIIILDANRERAVLGCTELETIKTGTTSKTSESSLTLFDKEGKVLWRVPTE